MRPPKAVNNSVDLGISNSELPSKLFAAMTGIGKPTNLNYLFIGKYSSAVLHAFCISFATFLHHILHIVFRRANKEVRGITAKWRVAFVANKQAFWDGAIGQLVGDSMRRKMLAIIVLEFAVSLNNGGLPQPTVIFSEDVNVRPKAWSKGYFKTLGVMTRNIFSLTTRLFGYFERLTTTTLTQRGKMKFELREARGMILHVNSPFVTLTTPQDGSTHRCGKFMPLFLPYFTTFERVQQLNGGAA